MEITLPFMENIPTGVIRRASAVGGDNEMAIGLAIMEEILDDDAEELLDPLLQRELAELVTRWRDQSATELGESSAS